MAMSPLLYHVAWVVAFVVVQGHAFKPLNEKYALLGGSMRCRGYYSWHRSSSSPSPSPSLFSIRGGSSNDDTDDEYDENDASYYDFIASFESELAEIRREAELEAENEMKKIRGLIERRDGVDEVDDDDDDEEEGEEEVIEPDYQGDGSNENDQHEGIDGDSDVVQVENVEAIPEEDGEQEEANESTDLLGDSDGVMNDDDEINQQDIELEDEKDAEEEVDEVLNDDQIDVHNEMDLSGDNAESVDFNEDSIETIDSMVDDFKSSSTRGKKPKASKKKSKAKKKKVKSRIDSAVESDTSDGGRIEVGESVLITRSTRDSDEEVAQTRQSGIWYYLRSDLGRALCLFIATIIVAILTKRLERQMAAEGITI
jgi:hypothetical protein